MKEKYKLNKKELKKRRKEDYKKIKNSDTIKKDEIENLYWDINIINEILSKNFFINFSSLLVKNKDKLNYFYTKIYEETSEFQRRFAINIHDIYIDNEQQYDSSILKGYLSFKDKVNLIYKLFSFNDTARKMCNLVFDYQNNILDLNNKNQNCTFCLSDKKIIKARKKDDIESFLVLAHELGHYYEFLIKEKEQNNFEYNSYTEIFSLFFELLSIDLLKDEKIITEKERINLLYNTYDMNLCNIKDYLFLTTQTNFNLRDKLYIKRLRYDELDSFEYFYSFAIATDLYFKYKDNKANTLKILNNIANNLDINNEEEFLKRHNIDTTGKSLKKFIRQ